MECQVNDAKSLAVIDREIGTHIFSPAEYEIVRQVIYATADFEYKSLIRFSETALQAGAAALAARTTIVVDIPMVKVGIIDRTQHTFVNLVYCSKDVYHQSKMANLAWGMKILAKRYPEGIFVVGQSEAALATLVDLVEAEEIRPALIVGTSPRFLVENNAKKRLRNSLIPHIIIDSYKGNAVVASAIVNGLIDLAWQAYGKKK
ncbi:MAG: precorrin-8X methylmutase [Calothrix sp. MO_167.B42]|nr:precorrin-8X methylmutase [Calothrix sp. MO_167.B42]